MRREKENSELDRRSVAKTDVAELSPEAPVLLPPGRPSQDVGDKAGLIP